MEIAGTNKDIERQVEEEINKDSSWRLKKDENYYVRDNPKLLPANQDWTVIAFCPARSKVLEEAEIVSFTQWVANTVKRVEIGKIFEKQNKSNKVLSALVEKEITNLTLSRDNRSRLIKLLKSENAKVDQIKDELTRMTEDWQTDTERRTELAEKLQQEVDEDDAEEKAATLHELFTDFLNSYLFYKSQNKVHIRNKIIEHFKSDKVRIDHAIKVSGSYKSAKKAQERAKEIAKESGFHTFVAKTGYFHNVNPSKYSVENYESTHEKLNEMVREYKEEQAKAERAFALRKKLYMNQGKLSAEALKEQNKKDIAAGKYDDPEDKWTEEGKIPKEEFVPFVSVQQEGGDAGPAENENEIDLLEITKKKNKKKDDTHIDEVISKAEADTKNLPTEKDLKI